MIACMHPDDDLGPPGASSEDARLSASIASVDVGDLTLIDDMLARSPEERLSYLGETLRSLEALLAATGSAIPAE